MSVKRMLLAGGAVAMLAPSTFAAFTLSSDRTAIGTTGLERVVLYALGNATSGDVTSADLTVTSSTPNGLKFANPIDVGNGVEDTVPVIIPNVLTANNTRGNNFLFNLIAPGMPEPINSGQDVNPTYANGLTTFHIVGLDGRSVSDVGLKADSSINGGKGAALFAAVVPAGTTVTFDGGINSDIAGDSDSDVNVTNLGTAVPEPTSLAFLGLAAGGMMMRRRRQA